MNMHMRKKFGLPLALGLGVLLLAGCDNDFYYGGGGGHGGGGWHGGGHSRGGWNGGGGWHGRGRGPRHMFDALVPQDSVGSAEQLARDYALQLPSAKAIVQIAAAKDKDALLAPLGLTSSDFASLKDFKLPSRETIARLAQSLHEDEGKVEHVLFDFVQDAYADSLIAK